ncbi:response regulator [Undibacterium jejuense]|uniref:Response regulator n=1 Tax=Undibacterium jejuense TaxID=1344949 RepID=A0A923HHT5_9BURK|nr:response regulator [Undibacterium jejuense]MBC3863994.1 response regulator [Undibacterium jejuense]
MDDSLSPSDNARLHVMIVDDDDFQIEFVSDLLAECGIKNIVTALGGKSGLTIFDHTNPKPDLLLCDIQMPDIDGFEFMKKLGERNYTGGVILMSGQGAKVLYSASLVAQLARQNFLGTIEKPLQKDALMAAIEKLYAKV